MEMERQNYRFLIQYEGSRYSGWQKLSGKEQTIQGKLENILERMTGEPVTVIGSGRTDAGVHAKGQVANAHLAVKLSEEEILEYINEYLPEDIAVLEVTKVSDKFHSRHHAVEKCYLYRVSTAQVADVFKRRYVYAYQSGKKSGRILERDGITAKEQKVVKKEKGVDLDLAAMRKAAGLLVGEHDFQGFCGRKIKKKSTVRNIYSIEIEEKQGEIRFYYRGNGFLFHMIRIITGTLLEIGAGKRKPEDVERILISRERQEAGETAPAKGLTLLWVSYDGDDGINR